MLNSQLPSTKSEAKERNLRFYFTGKPCVLGHIAKRRTNGSSCTECTPVLNKERAGYIKDYHKTNSAKVLENTRRYKERNKDKIKAAKANYAKRYPYKIAAQASRRRKYVKRAIPPWSNRALILEIYRECARITEETGIPHEVDHIFPLCGSSSSGLHVHQNLQIITREANRRKGTKVIE